jgi:hypothetical protein
LYYALIEGRANLLEYEAEVLGVDRVRNADQGRLLKAGFSTSGVSNQERVVSRQPQSRGAGLNYWLSFDFADINDNDSIYEDPLDFGFAGGEVIFNLPNGMQGYYVSAADGTRLNEAPVDVVVDPAQDNGAVINGASCHRCHNGGLIPFVDAVRSYVESNLTEYDAETVFQVFEQYIPQDDWSPILLSDSEVHLSAVERAGVTRGLPDPISSVFLQFKLEDMLPEDVAGELGVTLEELLRNENEFQFVFAGGRTRRAAFTGRYVESLCFLQAFSQNRPALCE